MKSSLSVPAAIAIAVVALAAIGFLLWKQFLYEPPVSASSGGPTAGAARVFHRPANKEEAMRMYRGGH